MEWIITYVTVALFIVFICGATERLWPGVTGDGVPLVLAAFWPLAMLTVAVAAPFMLVYWAGKLFASAMWRG